MSKRDELARDISSAVETIIVKGTNIMPFVRPDVNEVVKKVNNLSNDTLHLQKPADFFGPRVLVGTLDQAAKDYVRNAQMVATGSGGATGSLGLPGLAIDLPILVASTVGMVRRHALVYGFTDIEEAGGDRVPLLFAFAAALGAENAISRVSARIGAGIAGDTMERLLARVVSEEMATRIATRWLARVVPVVSSVTGAALDYLFLAEAGRRSMKHYRDRHMLVRQQMVAAESSSEL